MHSSKSSINLIIYGFLCTKTISKEKKIKEKTEKKNWKKHITKWEIDVKYKVIFVKQIATIADLIA